jgi:hypothetical protein
VNQSAALGRQFNEHAERHHTDDHADDLIALFEIAQSGHCGHHGRRRTANGTFTERFAQP